MTEDNSLKVSLVDEVRSGDTRRSLVALRDYLANELEGNRCPKCRASQLRTGDTASLALRLQKVIEDIASLPPEKVDLPEGVPSLDGIRSRRSSARPSDPPNPAPAVKHGTKSAPRRQGD